MGAVMKPDWRVIAVFDPENTGQDFAYTVGLHRRGLPELHLWARPTNGDDPGADFKLSSRDCMQLLNVWAGELISGELGVGHTRTVPFDAGASKGVFTAGEPVQPDAVDAFQAHPQATVIPMMWELNRPEIGPVQELDPAESLSVQAQVASLRAQTAQLEGIDVPVPNADGSIDLGPRHDVVMARIERLAATHSEDLLTLVEQAAYPDEDDVRGAMTSELIIGMVQAAARPAGLTDQVAAAMSLAQDLARAQVGNLQRREQWLSAFEMDTAEFDTQNISDSLKRALAYPFAALLIVDVLGVHAPQETRDCTQKWWAVL
jgi:hypothetical protein